MRFESEADANRQETLQEAAIANQIKTQAEKQWDQSRIEIAQQALALDTAKRALAYQEGLVAVANMGTPAKLTHFSSRRSEKLTTCPNTTKKSTTRR